MLRTWPVRFSAIRLTLSVRSFQVPATPSTRAWPPSLPSVPTSRATRVTSEAKPFSWSTIVFTTLPIRRNSPRSGRPSISTVMLCERSPLATAPMTRETSPVVLDPPALADLAFLADDPGEALEFLSHLVVERDHLVEQSGNFAVDAVGLFGQADAEVAAAQRTEGAKQLAAIDEVARGLDVHSNLRVAYSPTPVDPNAAPRLRFPT